MTMASGMDTHTIFDAHPRPDWARRAWTPLDGTWGLVSHGRTQPIRVPFPVGSAASGVDLDGVGRFRYARAFDAPNRAPGRRSFLTIGACDHDAEVVLNGTRLGAHTGGYASFTLEITSALRDRDNHLEVRVQDTRRWSQVRGKQTFLRKPFAVWYRGTAGIWQSVWIEETGSSAIMSGRATPDFDRGMLQVEAQVSPDSGDLRLDIEIGSPEGTAWTFEAARAGDAGRYRADIPLTRIGPRLWSPADPALYSLRYVLRRAGDTVDSVESYVGLRRVTRDSRGILINGVPTYLRMALVQGYYPEGSYTPLSTGRMAEDIRALKDMGFNGARIHQKIESPHFHYLCDTLGLLTTYEMPSFYRASRRVFREYASELQEIIDRDSMHPSCMAWVLFNETWGIWRVYSKHSPTRRFVLSMIDLVKRADPTRPVIDNNGWEHLRTDIVDVHHYLKSGSLARAFYERIRARDPATLGGLSRLGVIRFYLSNTIGEETRAMFLDHGAPADSHAGAPWLLSEYRGFGWYAATDGGSVTDRIEAYTRDAVDSGLFCGYCLTQLYDVEKETNGLLTFDRAPKVDPAEMRRINDIRPGV
jgi:beta-galactosidase/beta-glucuronidase